MAADVWLYRRNLEQGEPASELARADLNREPGEGILPSWFAATKKDTEVHVDVGSGFCLAAWWESLDEKQASLQRYPQRSASEPCALGQALVQRVLEDLMGCKKRICRRLRPTMNCYMALDGAEEAVDVDSDRDCS